MPRVEDHVIVEPNSRTDSDSFRTPIPIQPNKAFGFGRNRCSDSLGISVQIRLESVFRFDRCTHCGDDPANLYQFENCDFDSSAAGWTGTSISRGGVSFPAGSPAGNLNNAGSGVITTTGPCITTAAVGVSYNFGAHFRLLGGTSGSVRSCRIVLTTYTQADCTGSPTVFEPANTNVSTGSWFHSSDTAMIPVGTMSVELGTSCVSTPATSFSVAMDNFYIGEGIALPVELEAFDID